MCMSIFIVILLHWDGNGTQQKERGGDLERPNGYEQWGWGQTHGNAVGMEILSPCHSLAWRTCSRSIFSRVHRESLKPQSKQMNFHQGPKIYFLCENILHKYLFGWFSACRAYYAGNWPTSSSVSLQRRNILGIGLFLMFITFGDSGRPTHWSPHWTL